MHSITFLEPAQLNSGTRMALRVLGRGADPHRPGAGVVEGESHQSAVTFYFLQTTLHFTVLCYTQPIFKRFYLLIFRERGREGQKEEEKHRDGIETSFGCLSHAPQLGTEPAAQACALTGNRTGDFLLCGMTPNRLVDSGTRPDCGD